ncbi:MAG: filamentous hemagglutinin family protein [Thiobacillus sp.]
MNRNRYRLVFNTTSGMMVPVADTARRQGKAASGMALAGVLLAGAAHAELPVPSAGGAIPAFVTAGQAAYQVNGTQAYVNQVGNKSILNWQSFNVGAGHGVQFRQVDSLATQNLVPGASFTSLNRIHDINPSVIAGSVSQAAGQKANVILVNSNGIAFMGGSQVNLNSFTASTLNIADSFILDTLLTTDGQPQFEKALDGGEGRGFIKVFENAKISAGSQGRVMLIAPTVINKGKVEAPDGQVVLAAGSKIFLRTASAYGDEHVRGLLVEVDSADVLNDFDTANTDVKDGQLDGRTVALRNAAEDKLGHATNLGELTSPRGNVTMVGYAVNQLGIARATTSVVANGSVYLLAKDDAQLVTGPDAVKPGSRSDRAGRVVLGAGSLTEVLPEVADASGTVDGATGDGLPARSQVQVLGQDIRMEGGAVIDAPAGEVTFIAMDRPADAALDSSDPFKQIGGILANARIHIADGARISVAGLENVQVSAARNSVEVELRGDELKDSPINREGALRGEKVYVDVNRALANADAGTSTLIAKDSLESYQAKLERTVAERSTAGGLVKIQSQGEAILESGAMVDLSGGSVQYTAANTKTTLLTSDGRLIDIANADAETRYDGIATRYVVDYGRWNRKEVIDLGQSYRYDPGYVEGKDAGVLEIIGMGGAVLQADVIGRTTTGELQRDAGQIPAGARVRVGSDAVAGDYKLNQRIDVSSTAATLPVDLKTVLGINPASVGKDRIAQLEIFSNQAAEIREALRTPQGGGVQITARSVNAAADVTAQGGRIALNARANQVSGTLPLDTLNVTVGDGVSLTARGEWINQSPATETPSSTGASIDGGSITLSAVNDVDLGEGAQVDVTGGGRIKPDGKLAGGKGGAIKLEANAGVEATNLQTGAVRLAGELSGHGMAQGGSLTVSSGRIQIGGAEDTTAGALNLDGDFVNRGGFSDIKLTGRDGLTVADGVSLAPVQQTLELQPGHALQASGSRIEGFSRRAALEPRLRKPVNLTLSADAVTRGDVRIGEGARIDLDDKAKLEINAAHRIEIEGELRARGGDISATLDRSTDQAFDPASAIWLGEHAILDTSGVARTYTDSRGLTQGEVLSGGTAALNAKIGYVVTQAGSKIDVSGAAPVRLDVPNEAGGLGRNIGSDAGSIAIVAREGALLDGTLAARAGGDSNRGGSFALTLGDNATPSGAGHPTGQRVISLADAVPAQAAGLAPGGAIPASLDGQAKLGAAALEAAGFDRIALKSRDAIRLENGLDLGAGRARPLRDVTLDSPRLETAGGDAILRADVLRLGNYDAGRQSAANTATPGSGTLTAQARLLELAGNHTLTGMARVELKGEEEIRLAGVSVDGTRPVGSLSSAADMIFHGAVVAPATYAQHTILAPGQRIEFSRNTASPMQPLSALGSLKVEAGDIVQDGNLWAPFGQIELDASGSLVFRDGSLTSVAAAPGSLTPFGKVVNGQDWVYAAGSTLLDQDRLADKAIRVGGAAVDMQAGAKIDLSGGGDLQAYEFTVGPGGSRDILSARNTYAILPGFRGGFAPADAQEKFDRATGEAVYLSGVDGLADGVYTLLPAHYALLPGAYAVKLDTGVRGVMPGQAYSRQDGVRIAAGYVTDTRAGAPKDANWQGVQVLTHDQVRARSEFTLVRASEFFADGRNRPQDAGLLSVNTTGSGPNALKLDAIYDLAAAPGGRGGQVDISALKLAVTGGTVAGLDPDAVVLDAGKLDALGAESLFIGGTRSNSGDTTTLTVGADAVTLANDAAHALEAGEVMLAAKNTLTLKSGSAIDAQGEPGDAGHYQTEGNGAFVRAASTTATFARTGSPDGSAGTLIGEAGGTIAAADSITLDATLNNAFKGETGFQVEKDGVVRTVAGNLGVGARRVNFGAAPSGAEGITYSQDELDALNLKTLALTSYFTFDLYGDVRVGQLDGDGRPLMKSLTLQGAGLAGVDNAGKTAQINAQNLTLANSAASAFAAGGALGSGNLEINADTLALGAGDKAIKGFGSVSVTANELVAAAGTGTLDIDAPATLNVARISGERYADQTLTSTGALDVAQHTADRILAPVTALGAKWAMQGASIDFDSHAELPSGGFKLAASSGDVTLGAHARVDVAGREVQFFDVKKPSWGGTAEFVSETGNVKFETGSNVDVSAAAGGDAGTLIVRAAQGAFTAAEGSVEGKASKDADGRRGEGARAEIDVKTLASFSALNTALNGPERIGEGAAVNDGFDGARALRVRTGDVSIAGTDSVRAHEISIAADGGKLDVQGTLDASGEDAGRIELFAKDDVNVLAGAELLARSSGAGEDGGDIEIGTRDGSLNLVAGSTLDVAGGAGGQGGTVLLRAPRVGSDVAVAALDSAITGARSVAVEAVKVYDGVTTLNASGASSGTTLSLATIDADDAAYAVNHGAIKTRLGAVAADPAFHILSGVEVRSAGDLALGKGSAATDWNLKNSRAGGEAGVLTLRAAGNLSVDANLSDGFSDATASGSGALPTLLADESWSYRLVAGADQNAANPLAVIRNESGGNVALAAGKLIRTGTGDIRVAAGGNIELGDNKAAIYSAGRTADALTDFTNPDNAQFSTGGGDVRLAALGDIVGAPSVQLYSNWLFRQGDLDGPTQQYLYREPPTDSYPEGMLTEIQTQPAWWVRFDQFQQGVGALGGGDVSIAAGGKVENVSASAPTQARMASATPDTGALVKTGGGDVRVEAGGDLLGGQYYADNGMLAVQAGGNIVSGQKVGFGIYAKPLYTILALGDAQASVRAGRDLDIQAIINPHLVVQSKGALGNIVGADDSKWSLFSTYGNDGAVSLETLNGSVNFHNVTSTTTLTVASLQDAYKTSLNFSISSQKYTANLLSVLPPSLTTVAFQGDATLGGLTATLSPEPSGKLSVLAGQSVNLPVRLAMSDTAPFPDAVSPGEVDDQFLGASSTQARIAHAVAPVHIRDAEPVRIYAVAGDVRGDFNELTLKLPKSARIRAGQDVVDLGLDIQHVDSADVSQVRAGRDIRFDRGENRTPNALVWIGGPGRLELTAGRDIDLGTSAGVASRGELDNPALPAGGADIHLAAGVGAGGIDYAGTVDRLLAKLEAGSPDDTTLWLARWLTGNEDLSAADALSAVQAVGERDQESRRGNVRDMIFTALRATGRDSLQADSAYAADYARGYAALELAFPGIGSDPDAYRGSVDLFASRIRTERGGDIEFLIPGGDLIVGLSNTPEQLTDLSQVTIPKDKSALGMVTVADGAIRGFARDDVLVNQSRILTVGGGDILLWSSEGDIDAGKGKKTAATVPPPLIKVDKDGNVTLELQGAATGSGIGALTPAGGVAGDVDLIAPRGTVNAGDAGIRAGNLNIAAQVVLGADNITVSGTSTGTPVADTSAVSAASSGASNGDGGVSGATDALSRNLADAARAAEELKQAFRPTFISAEVIGHGE